MQPLPKVIKAYILFEIHKTLLMMPPNCCCKIWDNVKSPWNIVKHYPDSEIIPVCKGQFNGMNAITQCTFLVIERKTLGIFRNANKKK